MIRPQRLKKGNKIGIIAPSSPITDLPLETINRSYSYLKNKGFRIVESKQLSLKTGHTAGSIKQRVKAIHDFFRDRSIKCIMAFWGGYNCNQLIDYLDYELIRNNPKIFIGYSDMTVLTAAITAKTGIITFSGPGVISFAKPEPFKYTWQYFKKMCIDPIASLRIEPSEKFADDLYYLRKDGDHRIIQKNQGFKIFQHGIAHGQIIAGNLQSLLILYGSPYFPEMKDKILFLEEDEEANTGIVDRFLTQCQQIGIFDQARGVVFGRFVSQTGFNKNDSVEALFREIFKEYSFPVMYNLDFGHSDPLITIPHGGMCHMNTAKKEIIFDQAVA